MNVTIALNSWLYFKSEITNYAGTSEDGVSVDDTSEDAGASTETSL